MLHAFQMTKSETISFPPALVHAQVAMTAFEIEPGGGTDTFTAFSGISHRPTVDGADVEVKISGFETSVVGVIERTTAVSWMAYANGYVQASCDVFWSGEVAQGKPSFSSVLLQPGRAVVLYDAQSGEVRHVHQHTVLAGGAVVDNAVLERHA